MITIYVDDLKNKEIQQEISFLRYLSLMNFVNKKSIKKFTKDISIVFLINNSGVKTFAQKWALKNPKRILKNYTYLKNFVEIIKFKEATLTTLDSDISKYFKKGYKGQDSFILLTNNKRLQNYSEIFAGIGSTQFKFLNSNEYSLFQVLKMELEKINKVVNIKNLIKYYKLGTTAI